MQQAMKAAMKGMPQPGQPGQPGQPPNPFAGMGGMPGGFPNLQPGGQQSPPGWPPIVDTTARPAGKPVYLLIDSTSRLACQRIAKGAPNILQQGQASPPGLATDNAFKWHNVHDCRRKAAAVTLASPGHLFLAPKAITCLMSVCHSEGMCISTRTDQWQVCMTADQRLQQQQQQAQTANATSHKPPYNPGNVMITADMLNERQFFCTT